MDGLQSGRRAQAEVEEQKSSPPSVRALVLGRGTASIMHLSACCASTNPLFRAPFSRAFEQLGRPRLAKSQPVSSWTCLHMWNQRVRLEPECGEHLRRIQRSGPSAKDSNWVAGQYPCGRRSNLLSAARRRWISRGIDTYPSAHHHWSPWTTSKRPSSRALAVVPSACCFGHAPLSLSGMIRERV